MSSVGYGQSPLMLALVLIADLYMCDPRGLCSMQHDWIGGSFNDAVDRNRHGDADPRRHSGRGVPCRLGMAAWKNDCHR